MPVTLGDIAKDLQVSVVTVSKILRNQGQFSKATRDRVLRRARELNYQANWIARSLATRRTYTLGLLLPDFTHPFFGEIAKSISAIARPKGYHVIISYFEEDPEIERQEAESLLARQVDGLIVATAQVPGDREIFERVKQRKVPLVLIDRPVAGLQNSFVGVDNETIGRVATRHLVDQGCRRIAHLRGPEIDSARARLAGYSQVVSEAGCESLPQAIVPAGYEDASGHAAMKRLLRKRPIPDGVFCYNDPVAIGAMRAIAEAGLSVPHDIAVVGAGNIHYSDILAVPLTTVDQGTREIGRRAAELLLRQIESDAALKPRKVLIAPRLVVRASSQRKKD